MWCSVFYIGSLIQGTVTLSLFLPILCGHCNHMWRLLPHSFPGLITVMIRANCLWLVYLGIEILRNIPKQLLKLLLFRETSLSSLARHGLLNSTSGKQKQNKTNNTKQNKNRYLLIYLSWQALGPHELFSLPSVPLSAFRPFGPTSLFLPSLPPPLVSVPPGFWLASLWLFNSSGTISYSSPHCPKQKYPLKLQISSLVPWGKIANGKLLGGHR